MKPSARLIKQWHDRISLYVRENGPVVSGFGAVQFHHPKGRAFKHNKVYIGCWWVIPLPWQYHDVHSNDELNVTHYQKRFSAEFGRQCDLWKRMTDRMVETGIVLPFGEDVINAVMDTNY